jgi:prepilin-type N-terminal cleavage/methylation domain-containing protein
MKNKNQFNFGFTLIEMLVAITLFAIIIAAISGIFISTIRSQQKILATQQILDQTSYVLEYMSRALRMAKKDLTGDCIGTAGNNYIVLLDENDNPSIIRFLNYKGLCQQFQLEDNQIKERKSTDSTQNNLGGPIELTSPNLYVNFLQFSLSGEAQPPDDFLQPRVTISLEIRKPLVAFSPYIKIQTSISQRNIDTHR